MNSEIAEKAAVMAAIKPVAVTIAPWQARLRLGFTDDGGTTRLTERSHSGPLRVQKALYPEGGQVCHAIIVHPPGGVVGGDELAIDVQVHAGARILLATPGAAKWYKANGKISKQSIQIDIGQNSSAEWLPQETIFFDAAHVQLSQVIHLAKEASYIGCDILCFGRSASGESFTTGTLSQRSTIRREGKLVWCEQGTLKGGSAAMQSAMGLAGNTVCATLIAVGKTLPESLIDALRQEGSLVLEGAGMFGVTQLKGVVVVRYLGNASEMARTLMLMAWRYLRPALTGRDAVELRIWNT